MTFIDIAIIYLACGAPLSMHYFFAATRKLNLHFAAQIVLVAVFWPIAAFLLVQTVRKQRVFTSQIGQNDLDRRLDLFRIEIERSTFTDETAASVFEFRELFARYTGLAQAANARHAVPRHELFKLSSHEQIDLASICLERKARNRLLIHADAASEDLVSFIAASGIDAVCGTLPIARAMAELLNDHLTVTRLGELEFATLSAKKETSAGLAPQDAVPVFIR